MTCKANALQHSPDGWNGCLSYSVVCFQQPWTGHFAPGEEEIDGKQSSFNNDDFSFITQANEKKKSTRNSLIHID